MSSIDDLTVVVSDLQTSVSSLEVTIRDLIARNPGGVAADDPRVTQAVTDLRAVQARLDSLASSIPVKGVV